MVTSESARRLDGSRWSVRCWLGYRDVNIEATDVRVQGDCASATSMTADSAASDAGAAVPGRAASMADQPPAGASRSERPDRAIRIRLIASYSR